MGPDNAYGTGYGGQWHLRLERGVSIRRKPLVVAGCLLYLGRNYCRRFCTILFQRHGISAAGPHRNHANCTNLYGRPTNRGDDSDAANGRQLCDLAVFLHGAGNRAAYWSGLHAAPETPSGRLQASRWTPVDVCTLCKVRRYLLYITKSKKFCHIRCFLVNRFTIDQTERARRYLEPICQAEFGIRS